MSVTLSINGQSVHPVLTQPDPGLKCEHPQSCLAMFKHKSFSILYSKLSSLCMYYVY